MHSERSPISSRRFSFAPPGANARVLLAEDDPDLRALITVTLREDGYEVDDVTDGGRLLVHLAEGLRSRDPRASYDIVVTDVRMPVVNGIQILESIRGIGWLVPVIVMSAFGDAQLRRKTESLGAVMFEKPFEVDDLRTAVLHLVRPEPAPESRAPSLARVSSFGTWAAAREAQANLRAQRIEAFLAGPGLGPVMIYVAPRDEERARRVMFGAAI